MNNDFLFFAIKQALLKTAIIEAHIFPSVQFFTKYFIYNQIYIESWARFQKQSYRNRYRVLGSNKVLDLIVPVTKGKTQLAYADVEIAHADNWQREHLQTVKSCYGKAAYFEHYFHQYEALLQSEEPKLFNWAVSTIKWIEDALQLPIESQIATDQSISYQDDLRNAIHPKGRYNLPDSVFKPAPYFQCFENGGFASNLSILDLLFNEGPMSSQILQKSIRVNA